MFDPLAVLDGGEYGSDLLVAPEAVGDDYDNDDLTLVRCYRDGDSLRDVETDAFVRRLRGSDGGPQGVVPPDADPGEEEVSPLLLADVPPAFVVLDDPDDENVLTKVMALDVDLDKLAIVAKLGAAFADAPHDDVGEFEAVLDEIAAIDDTDAVEAVIERRLF